MAPTGAVVVQSDISHPIIQPLSAEQMAVVEEFVRQQDESMAVGDWQRQMVQQQQFDQWVENVLSNELIRISNQISQDSLKRTAKKRLRQTAGRTR